MTPEERDLVRDLFERLAELEQEPRDAEAERAIREGLSRAPNAVYALVQTVLLQDEALRAADERIAELEDAQAQGGSQAQSSGSFLGDRRGKWNTGEVLGGSVPSVGRVGERPMGLPPGYGGRRDDYADAPYGDARGGPMGGAGGPWQAGAEAGRGGSFLGTAAAAAAGVIGGGLLMGGIRSALGGHGDSKGPFAGALEKLGGGSEGGKGELSRDAGLGDIGASRPQGAMRDQTADKNAGSGAADENADSSWENDDFDHDEMHDDFGDGVE